MQTELNYLCHKRQTETRTMCDLTKLLLTVALRTEDSAESCIGVCQSTLSVSDTLFVRQMARRPLAAFRGSLVHTCKQS